MSHDAAVLFRVGGRSVLHTNDARISLAQARRAVAEVGCPDRPDGPADVRGQLAPDRLRVRRARPRTGSARAKRLGKYAAVRRLVRGVAPRMVMPYAGPPCFLDRDLFEHNGGLHGPGIFPDQDEALAWLLERLPAQRGTYLLPGDSLDLEDLEVVRDPQWADFSLTGPVESRRAYLEAYAARRRPEIEEVWARHPVPDEGPGLGEAFREHFEALATLSAYFLARIGMLLRFEVTGPGGGTWDAHIGPDTVRVDLDGGARACRLPAAPRVALAGERGQRSHPVGGAAALAAILAPAVSRTSTTTTWWACSSTPTWRPCVPSSSSRQRATRRT